MTPTAVPTARTTALERVVFALAIVLPPIGLIANIVAASRSARRRGWVPGLLASGIAVASVLTLVLAGLTVVADAVAADALDERAATARSQPMCRLISSEGLTTRSDFGLVPPSGSIDESIAQLRAFASRWDAVAAVAPRPVVGAAASVGAAATAAADAAAQSRALDAASVTTQLDALHRDSVLPAWVSAHC